MAIYEPGVLIGRARGKIGGLVATNARSSPVLRTWRKPIDPATTPQALNRANLSIAAAYWRDEFTAGQRTDWDALALTATLRNSLGNQFTPTGRQLFIRGAMFNLPHGPLAFPNAPAQPFPFWPQTSIAEAPPLRILISSEGDTSGFLLTAIDARISPPLNPSVNQFSGNYAGLQRSLWFNAAIPLEIISADLIAVNARYFIEVTPMTLNMAIGFKQQYVIDVTLA